MSDLEAEKPSTTSEPSPKRSGVALGVARALPIVLGYIPVGFAYGVLARKAGLSSANVVLMSLIVYAGASQFVAVGLMAGAASGVSIVVTTFIVNLRHLILASSLAPYLQSWRVRDLAIFSYQITDETFAVHATSFPYRQPEKSETLAVNMTAQISWIVGGALGAISGSLIGDVRPLALDFALPALFTALLAMQIKDRAHAAAALGGGLTAVGLHLAGLDTWNIIIGAVLGATLGMVVEPWIKKRSS